MNQYQRRVLWGAIGIAVLMLTVPPWSVRGGAFLGYELFWDFPGGTIDGVRLLIQLGILALVSGGAWLCTTNERRTAARLATWRHQLPRVRKGVGLVVVGGLASIAAGLVVHGALHGLHSYVASSRTPLDLPDMPPVRLPSLDGLAALSNSAPMMMDRDTEWTGTVRVPDPLDTALGFPGVLDFRYRLVNVSVEAFSPRQLADFLVQLAERARAAACDPNALGLFQRGFRLRTTYVDKDGQDLAEFDVKPRDCNGL